MKTNKKMKKAIELLEDRGLVYCSSKEQKKNGTLYFVDPKTMTAYSITAAGYCRRHTFGNFHADNKLGERHYQLNKTERTMGRWGTEVRRILEPEKYVKLAKQLEGPIESWRKNT